MSEYWCLVLAAFAAAGLFVWIRIRYQLPLKRLISTLDLGADKDRPPDGWASPVVRRLTRRCLDYDKIFQIQQNELDRSQQNSDLLLDSLDLFVGFFSDKFTPRYINRYGRYRLDILDRPLEDVRLTQMLEPEFLRRLWVQLRRKGQVTGMDGHISLPLEGERDVRVSIIPIGRREHSVQTGYLVLAEDVSRQRRIELNLQNQIALSQHIFDTIPEFILVVDNNLTILFANDSVTRFTGVEKMLGRQIGTILSVQAQADGFDEYLRNAIKNRQPLNRINILNPIGAGNNFVDLLVKPLHRGRRQIGALILIRDVSEWRELTEEIRSLQTFTDKVINASPYALLSIDAADRITVWNKSAELLFHKKEQEVLNMELFHVVGALTPFRETITEVKIIGRAQFQAEQELVIHGESRLVNMNFYPIYNNGTNVVVSIEDVTTVRALQRSLTEAQKMGTLGMLTRGIVHDLNNMLTGILGRASILKKKIPAESDLQKDVEIIAQSGERVSELISRIHQFSKQRLDRERPVCLNQVVNQTMDLLKPNLQGIKVSIRENDPELWVIMDQTKISQIVVNLVVNARDAVKWCSQPELVLELSRQEIKGHARLIDGQYAQLQVADNGSGIASEHLAKIFEPFFSTKASEHGTGIGLATVQTLINEANGSIEVESVLGAGSTFTILLPGKEPQAPAAAERADASVQAGHALPGCVLLIDDEAVVRDIGMEMLETLGIQALTAVNGREGLRVYQENREQIDLILLDVEMPDMGGEETFDGLRELGCSCPIVIASGYNRDYLERQVFSRQLQYYLAKPFQIAQLSALLQELAEDGKIADHGDRNG